MLQIEPQQYYIVVDSAASAEQTATFLMNIFIFSFNGTQAFVLLVESRVVADKLRIWLTITKRSNVPETPTPVFLLMPSRCIMHTCCRRKQIKQAISQQHDTRRVYYVLVLVFLQPETFKNTKSERSPETSIPLTLPIRDLIIAHSFISIATHYGFNDHINDNQFPSEKQLTFMVFLQEKEAVYKAS